MNKFRFTLKFVAIAIFTFAFASIANAQASRTWVSGVGDDANPCSRTAPCKTWAGAISKTAACGEIDALIQVVLAPSQLPSRSPLTVLERLLQFWLL